MRRIVLDAPVSHSVYSAFSFYGTRRGNELPGRWLVAALGSLGHEPAAIRQTLYRMEGSGVLLGRAVGREKFYRLGGAARESVMAGTEKIMTEPSPRWDGLWTLVQFRQESGNRADRELLLDIVQVEGFARIGPRLFIHPRDRSARLWAAARAQGFHNAFDIFRGKRMGGDQDRAFVERHWDLQLLAAEYRNFLARFRRFQSRDLAESPSLAFLLRFAVVFDFLETAWRDPDVPPALLPHEWPAIAARRLARALYLEVLPTALAYGDDIMARAT